MGRLAAHLAVTGSCWFSGCSLRLFPDSEDEVNGVLSHVSPASGIWELWTSETKRHSRRTSPGIRRRKRGCRWPLSARYMTGSAIHSGRPAVLTFWSRKSETQA